MGYIIIAIAIVASLVFPDKIRATVAKLVEAIKAFANNDQTQTTGDDRPVLKARVDRRR